MPLRLLSLYTRTRIIVLTRSLQRGLVGPIISRFENRGFKLVAIKLTAPGKEHLEKHYADLSDKPFFAGLVNCTSTVPASTTDPS
jgi:nucleoside-diphosphate kinase